MSQQAKTELENAKRKAAKISKRILIICCTRDKAADLKFKLLTNGYSHKPFFKKYLDEIFAYVRSEVSGHSEVSGPSGYCCTGTV
jgi:hypothetical protein